MDTPQNIKDAITANDIQRHQRYNSARSGFPGEHCLALGAGVLILRSAGRRKGLIGRMIGRFVDGALATRAASGRDGVMGMLLGGAASSAAGVLGTSHRTGG